MTATAYETAVKLRLGISDTSFDSEVTAFVAQAPKRLAPKAMLETAAEEVNITVSSTGEVDIDMSALSVPIKDIRKVEVYDGVAYFEVTEKSRHNTTLTLRGLSTDITKAKLYGLDYYEITEVPEMLEQAIIWYAMAEFYDFLSSNKAKFNIYSQSNGARGVDAMRDEAVYYESKAEVYVDEHSTAYGS